MHPHVFLKTLWRLEMRPQVFVAMSFSKEYDRRFEQILAPAIRSVEIDGLRMEPYRVDSSRSGDSVLTDIVDGIAHSQLVLADVSVTGKDSITGNSYRSANVMYEVGLALACRQPAEVLLVRDDREEFLFDVSTIPHLTVDFDDHGRAENILKRELDARIKERRLVEDARARMLAESLTDEDISALRFLCSIHRGEHRQKYDDEEATFLEDFAKYDSGHPRLLDKQIVRRALNLGSGAMPFIPTQLGEAVNDLLDHDGHA